MTRHGSNQREHEQRERRRSKLRKLGSCSFTATAAGEQVEGELHTAAAQTDSEDCWQRVSKRLLSD